MYFNAIFNNYLSNLVTDPIFEENEIIVDESYLLESDTRTDWIEPDPFNTFIMYEEPDGYHESIMDELDTGEPIIFESEVYDNSVQYDNDNISVDCETIMDKLRTDELILFEPEIDDASFQFENTSVDWSMLDEDLLSEHNNNDELVYADISPTVISPDDHCEANSNVTSAIPTRAESSPNSSTNDMIKHYEDKLKEKDEEIAELKEVISKQKKILKSFKYDVKSFEGRDTQVKHLTGLPTYSTLKTVYNFVEKGIVSYSDTISKEQAFVMVLMFLRLGLCFKTLAHLYQVSPTTITKYFYSTLYSLYVQLGGLLKWPEKEVLESNMPEKYRNVFEDPITVILDCFEVFTEKPGVKDAIIKMYSSYKHHYTFKELVGITPFGSISYASRPYTGRTSDKHITEQSGFMNYIKAGDVVLADRGFTVRKAVQDRGALLKVPDSASKSKQMSSSSVERTRALASVRNEVERAIGSLRQKSEVLSKRVPITVMNHEHNGQNVLNMIIVVCCAIFNLCPAIIR
ncbi:uncharacterized protein LOC134285432 isoform X1 [Aedes albopictus]|uniref:DDE Tnp4 domain-containing protein n=2 Tax=Aedes albopictus TaxID=7160 RepID=A0ABM1ZUJ2_AEDAL